MKSSGQPSGSTPEKTTRPISSYAAPAGSYPAQQPTAFVKREDEQKVWNTESFRGKFYIAPMQSRTYRRPPAETETQGDCEDDTLHQSTSEGYDSSNGEEVAYPPHHRTTRSCIDDGTQQKKNHISARVEAFRQLSHAQVKRERSPLSNNAAAKSNKSLRLDTAQPTAFAAAQRGLLAPTNTLCPTAAPQTARYIVRNATTSNINHLAPPNMSAYLTPFLKQCYAVPLRPYQLRAIAGLTRSFVDYWVAAIVGASAPAGPAERVGGVVHLRTGAGKTDIAAAVAMTELLFPYYLAKLQGNGNRPSFSPKDFVMLTPTRVLTEQQSKLFVDRLGQPAVLELLRYANVGVDILVSTQGTVSPVASLNDSAKTNRVRILVSTPGSYTEIVGSAEPLFRRGVAPNFPMPQHCSTVFFDEVHHCAAGHPFTEVAGAVHTAKLLAGESGGDSVRMVGLTATLCYARMPGQIEAAIRGLFAMLLAPLAERYAATDEELRACGVPEPPKCAVLDFYEADPDPNGSNPVAQFADGFPGTFSDLAGLDSGSALSTDRTERRRTEALYPPLLIPGADVQTMVSRITASFPALTRDSAAFDGPEVVFSVDAELARRAEQKYSVDSDDASGDEEGGPPAYALVDRGVHVYTKHIFKLATELERELGLVTGRQLTQIGGSTALRDLPRMPIARLALDRERFLTADPKLLLSLAANGATLKRHNGALTPRRALLGELMCVLYQALRLIIASKQRDVELAVRYLHRSRRLFDALGGDYAAFLDTRVPLDNPKTGAAAFRDCGRVVDALRHFASQDGECGGAFRTIVFCESSLAVAVLAEYLTECFAPDDAEAKRRAANESTADESTGKNIQWTGDDYRYRADWLASTGNGPAFNIPHRSTGEQADVVAQFRDGRFNVLCATTVVEEGLDVSAVRCIIHLSPPTNPVAQTQRSGRARAEANTRSVVLGAHDGALVTSLAGVAEVQAEVADALSAGPDATVVPMPNRDAVQSTQLAAVRRIIGAPSTTTVVAPSAGISAVVKRRLLAGNPIAAINELAQLGHCGKPDEEVNARPFHGGGGFKFIVTMRFEHPALTVSGEELVSKKDARTSAAAKALQALFDS